MQRFLPAALLFAVSAFAAGPEEKAVLHVVQRFFDVLASRDAEAGRQLLTDGGQFTIIAIDKGKVTTRVRSFAEFLSTIANGKEKLLERMWTPKVEIHGSIASVWTPYDFHRDGKFSHCGVDGFHLVKLETGWKIAGAIYTVEREGCKSPLPPPAH
ncbi:MAG: nuclear transport factor 2 family protein [Acidimicrobiia bacterium]|nr:nuclear transport factor 2 family protein [Acidimicrobiia bacterium]